MAGGFHSPKNINDEKGITGVPRYIDVPFVKLFKTTYM